MLLLEPEVQRSVHEQTGLSRSERKQQQGSLAETIVQKLMEAGLITRSKLTLADRFLAILPKQMVVFVRIPGCSSLAVFARYLTSSPLIVRSDNLPITAKTALTVCSRTTGARSVNPVTWLSVSIDTA